MSLSIILLSIVVMLYVLAFAFYVMGFVALERKQFSWGSRFVELGFLVHTLVIFTQTFTVSQAPPLQFHLPVTTLGEASGFFAWSLAFVYLILLRQLKTEVFGLILTPTVIVFLIPSFFPFHENVTPLTHFHNAYFLLHILSAFFGYASFSISFVASAFYLYLDRALKRKTPVQFYHRLPSLDRLERFVFRTIRWGIVLLGIAILTGALWAKAAFGTFIVREPKSFSTFLTLGVYLAIIYFHSVRKMKGRRLMLMAFVAFVFVLFTFLGTSIFRTKLHVGVW